MSARRVPTGMLVRYAIALVLIPHSLQGQPGPLEQPLHVVVELDHAMFRNGVAQYIVIDPDADTLSADELRVARSDSAIAFWVNASHDARAWSIKYLPGGAVMDLHLEHAPSTVGFTLRLPFTQGAFDLDARRMMKCVSDQADDHQVPDAQRTGWGQKHVLGAADTLACHGGRLLYARGNGRYAEVRIPDLMPFVKRVPRMPPTTAHEASYPGGVANFERFIRTHYSKPLIERTNDRVKLSALVTIETDGSIHQVDLNGSDYPELDREFKRVLQLSSWWEPATVENIRNTIAPSTYRYIEQSKVIESMVDPDSVWSEIPEEALTIMPAAPSSQDEITVTFHRIGGSCGQYEAYAEVQPPTTDGAPRDVFLHFGTIVPAQFEDRAPRSFSFTTRALPPGRYRFRQMPHPKLGNAWPPDPYQVRYIEVR